MTEEGGRGIVEHDWKKKGIMKKKEEEMAKDKAW